MATCHFVHFENFNRIYMVAFGLEIVFIIKFICFFFFVQPMYNLFDAFYLFFQMAKCKTFPIFR